MVTKVVNDTVVQQYKPMVYKIANEYNRKFRSVDRDDIVQEIWMWFITHPNKVKEWSSVPFKESERLFARSLRNAAMSFCVKEKARIEGYHVNDVFWYSKDFIKELLPAVLSDDWKRIQESFDGNNRTPKPPNEAGDWMVYAADIRKAYETLDDEDRKLVDLFYVNDVHGSVLMEETGRPTIRAAEMAANRAVGKMVKLLGGERPWMFENDVVQKPDEETQEKEDNSE